MNGIENVIAGTAFEVVARSFSRKEGSERNSFRLKNLTKNEALAFVEAWKLLSSSRGLDKVRLLVASDSHDDFPEDYRASPDHSITYYRNNNDSGLVYIETKVESDEQGLKNLFTLRDVNFLDGTFDEEGGFLVPEEMVRQALGYAGSPNPSNHVLLRDRLVEVLRELNSVGMTVPVRKFAAFVLSAADEVVSSSDVFSPEETEAVVGRSLVLLDMFPDECWRGHVGRTARRLSLNLLRSELAESPSADLDGEKTAQACLGTRFLDEDGELYEADALASWRNRCAAYCLEPTPELRREIPYRIFEQVFSKDVKGLPPGQRVSEEICDRDPSRKLEFDKLAVESGLDGRSAEEARKFLDSEPGDPSLLPLKDLLSKQTLKIVEKIASPTIERIENPLITLSQVVSDFRERSSLGEGEYRVEMRVGAGVNASSGHEPTMGLFAFLYGASLKDLCASFADEMGDVSLAVEDCLVRQHPVPPLKKEVAPDTDNADAGSSEEDEGVAWLPIPLEIVLVNVEENSEVDSEQAIEWLPEDYLYLALFWISVCGEDRCDVSSNLVAPSGLSGEEWISEVVLRLLPFESEQSKSISDEVLKNPVISRLIEIRSSFRAEADNSGISSGLLNDVFDDWSELLSEARRVFLPEGDVPLGMIDFLNADCVQGFDGDRVLMMQSHPLKLRWISKYLEKSSRLASDAIEGSLRLNAQNETLYLNWIQGLSPHQQPSIHTAVQGHLLFAAGERGWTENFSMDISSGGAASGDRIHASLVDEIVRQINAYLHAHPYKADGLRVLVVTDGASALPADIVQGVRKGEFRNLAMTLELVAPKSCWEEAARQFEGVDTDNRLAGDGALFPPVQLNLHDLKVMKANPDSALGRMVCDLAIVPQFLDDTVNKDAKTEDERSSFGKFNPLLDDPTYIESGAGSAALWVSLRPRTRDRALSDWSTMAVRHERKSPVAADRPEATDFIDIRIDFHNTARFFGALHKMSHWVITVERHITREQIERLETRPDVLSLRDGVGPGGLFTLIVSSNAGKTFVIDRLSRKLKRISTIIGRGDLAEDKSHQLAEILYEEARQMAPRLTLDALGISRVTEEILGLSVARKIAGYQVPVLITEGFVAWISLDEHPEWFASANAMRADMVRLAVNLDENGLSVDVLVLESKLRKSGYDSHGAEQVRKTLEMFEDVFPVEGQRDAMDGELWRDMLLSAVDTLSENAVTISSQEQTDIPRRRSKVAEEIRQLFREGRFASVNISGLYSICEYSHPREITVENYPEDSRVRIAKTGGKALIDGVPVPVVSSSPDYLEKSGGEFAVALVAEPGISEEVKQEVLEEDEFPTYASQQEQKSKNPSENEHAVQGGELANERRGHLGKAELDRRYQTIMDTFGSYGINVSKTAVGIEHAIEGPASILFRVRPGRGVAPNKLSGQHDALKLALELDASQDIRFDIDKGYVTIDVPKPDEDRYYVSGEDLWSHWDRPVSGLSVPLGEDRFGNIVTIDFTSSNSPHLLIGGTTGSGKSEALNTILAGITQHYSPNEVRLQLIDPKGTELEHLSGCEHIDGEIGWDEDDAIGILSNAVEEMQLRYARFKKSKVRNLEDYNAQAPEAERVPRWVIVLDEYADLTSEPESKKTIEAHLKRLAQKARAAGIHVIIATQKPDATVISTNLRSNLPAQLALRVKSATESRVIMDDAGAESLTGKGDAFFKESGVLIRVQCAKV